MVIRTLLRSLALLLLPATLAAAAPAPTIEAMLELTDLSSIAISPDGRTVVFRSEVASVDHNRVDLAWYVVPIDGHASPRRVAGAGDGTWFSGGLLPEPPSWSEDSRWFYYRADIGGVQQVWRARVDGGGAEQVTHDDADVVSFALTSRTLVYAVGATRAAVAAEEAREYSEGVRIDAAIEPALPLFGGLVIAGRPSTQRLTGAWFAKGPLLSDQPLRYRAIDLANGAVRDATLDEQKPFKARPQALAKAGGKLIMGRSDSGDARGSAYLLADGAAISLSVSADDDMTHATLCRDPACTGRTIARASWQGGANRVLFSTTDGVDTRLHLWDVRSGKVRDIATPGGTLNGGRESGLGCAVADLAIACVAADANTPPRLVAITIATGRRKVLANPNAGLIGAEQPRFEALRWTTKRGVAFTGQLLLPVDRSHRVPLFMTYYVCDGFLRGGTGDEYPLRQLAGHGIATLCINKPLRDVAIAEDQLAQYREALDGVGAVVDLLDKKQLIDRSRVGMGGLSFGSEVTMWVASHSDLLAAAAISSTQTTPTYYWLNAMPGRDVPAILQRVWQLGDPDDDRERWQAFSTALRTHDLRAPLLMQMPEQEYRYNIELAARMGRQGTPVDVWAFADEQHIKMQPRHKAAVYARNLDWFSYWLKGDVDPAPAKARQYTLWQSYPLKPGWHGGMVQAQDRSHASTSARASTP
jgi:dipeptidyl aminopeptidase/acylaminoacyl peptidase